MEVSRALERAINFTPVPHSQKMNYVPARVECINHTVITDPKSKAAASCETVMWKGCETKTHFVDSIFDASSNVRRKLEEGRVKARVMDLERRGHSKASGLAHARSKPLFHLGFRLANGTFKFRGEFQLILDEVIQPLADFSQFGGSQFFQLGLDLLNLAHDNRMPQYRTDFKFRTFALENRS